MGCFFHNVEAMFALIPTLVISRLLSFSIYVLIKHNLPHPNKKEAVFFVIGVQYALVNVIKFHSTYHTYIYTSNYYHLLY